jgi:hypothetical protein
MIYVSFNLTNPWGLPKFLHLGNVHGKFTKNKAWELEHYRCSSIVEFQFSFSTRRDHAGLEMTVGLLGYNIHANIYDCRHWNTDTNSWMKYEDSI